MAVDIIVPYQKWKKMSSLQPHPDPGYASYRQLIPEIKAWCEGHDIAYKLDSKQQIVTFRFAEDSVATLFKLTWL